MSPRCWNLQSEGNRSVSSKVVSAGYQFVSSWLRNGSSFAKNIFQPSLKSPAPCHLRIDDGGLSSD